MTTLQVAVRPLRRAGFVAVVAVVAAQLAKRHYKHAGLMTLVKRLVGWLLVRILHIPVPRVVSGPGSMAQLGRLATEELRCKKPLIVTDEMLVKIGLVKRAVDSLEKVGLKHKLFDTVTPDPPVTTVEQGQRLYKEGQCDSLIAIGGGSSIDAAKAIGCAVLHPGCSVRSFEGAFNVNRMGLKPLPPLIAIPTTAGTGSEATVAAVISIPEEKEKIRIMDLGLVPRVAVLDAQLLEKLPKSVTAATGMDALTHAVESFVSCWATDFSRKCSKLAVKKIFENMLPSYKNGGDLQAREAMLTASYEAGLALTRANVGYVHGIAHALGGMYHTPHGVANAMVLPLVLNFYLSREDGSSACPCTEKLCELAEAAGLAVESGGDKRALARRFIERITEMNREMAVPSEVPEMTATEVGEVATRNLKESHGELFGFAQPMAHLFDLGYPVPYYMTHEECQAIVAEVLPAKEKEAWKSLA